MGWRLFVGTLAKPEELERSRCFFDHKKLADPDVKMMRDERSARCFSTGDELGVLDEVEAYELSEQENIEHVARMATDLALMMSVAAVCRRSLKAMGVRGKSPETSREQDARSQ